MTPTITSVSPLFGPPGAAVTVTGSGFDAASRVAMPWLVETEYVDGGTVTCVVPEVSGPAGQAVSVDVFVVGGGGEKSNVLAFEVRLPAATRQGYTTVEAVAAEIPAFARGGQIGDDLIQRWIATAAQSVMGAMLKRGLSLDPAQWAQPAGDGTPAASDTLEMITRLGAAGMLASAVSSNFQAGDSPLARTLRATYKDELNRLAEGAYDKLFRTGAATVESGPLFSGGDQTGANGMPEKAFRKDQVF